MNQETNFNQKSRDELVHQCIDLLNKKEKLEIKLKQKDKTLETLSEICSFEEKPKTPFIHVLENIATKIAAAWQFPDATCVRIQAESIEYATPNFAASEWKIVEPIFVGYHPKGTLEVSYLEQKPSEDEGPFLREERILLKLIARELGRIIQHRESQNESDLRERNFSAAFNKSPVAKCLVNPLANFRILEVNEKFLSLSGFSREELDGKSLQDIDFYPKNIFTLAIIPEFKLNDKLRNFEFVFRNKRDEIKTTLLSADSITKELAVVVIYDITQLKEEGSKIIPDENRLRGIFDSMQDAYFQADLAGNFSLINPTALTMFGYSQEEEIVGQPANMLYADRHVRQRLIEKLKRNEKVTDETLQGLKQDGSTFWISMNVQFVYDRGGNIVGTQGVVRDITERIEAEIKSKEYQLQLKNAIEIAGLGFYTLSDCSEKLEYVDEKAASILNLEENDATGKSFAQHWLANIHEDDPKNILDADKKLDQKKTDRVLLRYRYRHPEKGWTWIKHIIARIEKDKSQKCVKKFAVVQDITSLKNAELAILENESKFRALSENSLTGVYMIENGCFLYTNHAFDSMHGYAEGELIGQSGDMLVHPEDRNLLLENYEKLISGKASTLEFELRGVRKDGKTIHLMNFESCSWIGSRQLFIGNILDITKRKEYEEKLLSFSRAVEQSPASIIITDVEGKIEYANPFFSQLTGYSREEYIGRTPRIMKSGHHSVAFYKQMWDTIKSGKTWEGELYNRKKDKSFYWEQATIAPIKNENGKIINFVAIKTDITESKEMTQKLISAQKSSEENRKWFEALFYTSPAFVSITRLNGQYVDVNESFQAISGYTKQELVALSSTDIDVWINPKDRSILLEELNARGQVERMETAFRLRNGQQIFAMVSAKFIELNNEQLILMVTQDFTQLKEAEAELIAAKEKAEESDRLKTAFLLNMSHEIRTPMNGILGFASLLNEPGLNDEERAQFISMIDKSGERLLSTINDIIEISKIEIGDVKLKTAQVNLMELMHFHYKFFQLETKEKLLDLEISCQISGDDAELITDKQKLDSILTNLIKNAIKFTSEGKIEIGNYLKDGHVWFFVADTGKGIPEEKQSTIFDRFRQVDTGLTRSYEGSGIGLSIVKAYIEILKGSIEVKSEVGKGTTFLFSIPYHPANKETKEQDS